MEKLNRKGSPPENTLCSFFSKYVVIQNMGVRKLFTEVEKILQLTKYLRSKMGTCARFQGIFPQIVALFHLLGPERSQKIKSISQYILLFNSYKVYIEMLQIFGTIGQPGAKISLKIYKNLTKNRQFFYANPLNYVRSTHFRYVIFRERNHIFQFCQKFLNPCNLNNQVNE